MTSFRNTIAVLFLLLACCSCQGRKEPIARLQEQLRRDSVTLSEIQRDYPESIRSNFRWCDSMLQYLPEEKINECFDVLNLAQAYLAQYDEMFPVMQRDLCYTRQQLTNLRNDIDSQYLSDSLAAIYLADETAVSDTLHHRILYFQDRLSHQEKALKKLRKTIHKAAIR